MTRPDPKVYPRPSLNGTAAVTLYDQFTDALNSVYEALGALDGCRPHPRDYQTFADPESAFATAREEHNARITALQGVARDIALLRGAVLNQGEG